jgi:hypothetical protein
MVVTGEPLAPEVENFLLEFVQENPEWEKEILSILELSRSLQNV